MHDEMRWALKIPGGIPLLPPQESGRQAGPRHVPDEQYRAIPYRTYLLQSVGVAEYVTTGPAAEPFLKCLAHFLQVEMTILCESGTARTRSHCESARQWYWLLDLRGRSAKWDRAE